MPAASVGIVVFGDVIGSRRLSGGASADLRSLARELDGAFDVDRLAPFGFTQGDEVQGLLAAAADPFRAVVRTALRPTPIGLRWAIAAGQVDPGDGPATERTGDALLAAREALTRARTRRDDLVAVTGDADADGLLADLTPLLAVLLEDLSDRQRELARLLLIDGLRRAEAADRLGVSRATVSVLADRGRIREIDRLARTLATIFGRGVARLAGVA